MADSSHPQGRAMHALAQRLFPIHRSLTGDGVRQSLDILSEHMPLQVHEVPSGSAAFDWTVPREWVIRDAWVEDESGRRVIDYKDSNLHVVAYSEPVDTVLSLAELKEHLHVHPDLPEAVPYVTSYYSSYWGFCLSRTSLDRLPEGRYRAVIDSEFKDGSLTYADLVLPGSSDREILLSTYICHPSLANNELSGPVLATWLAKWIMERPRRHTYRLVFVPECIGALVYLSQNLEHLRRHVDAGFVLTCLGDERAWSLVPSRFGRTLADKAARAVLEELHPDYIPYTFLQRGSDERQYCSPGVDLPVCSVMRSKYECFPEYHTSLDDLTLVTPKGLQGSYDFFVELLTLLEANQRPRVICPGEPQMGKRGLYPSFSSEANAQWVKDMMNFLAYADGEHDLMDIARIIGVGPSQAVALAEKLRPVLETD